MAEAQNEGGHRAPAKEGGLRQASTLTLRLGGTEKPAFLGELPALLVNRGLGVLLVGDVLHELGADAELSAEEVLQAAQVKQLLHCCAVLHPAVQEQPCQLAACCQWLHLLLAQLHHLLLRQ